MTCELDKELKDRWKCKQVVIQECDYELLCEWIRSMAIDSYETEIIDCCGKTMVAVKIIDIAVVVDNYNNCWFVQCFGD